ncbi:MAG: phosphate butyryltransferase [Lentisphaeria bacterium]|nr:phosphate butyryltransferase [Candidatus Neomarinimicrobiota bacterium]MCF7842957.1 phosphate butyryltransferase [Lentisphaeria bacterium]
MITSFDQLFNVLGDQPKKRIALAAAEDNILLEAAQQAQFQNLASFILVGNTDKISELKRQFDIEGDFQMVHSDHPAEAAVKLVRDGKADLLMKGAISSSALLKAVLDRDKGLRKGDLLSHVAVVESPAYHKLLFITDGGINIAFDEDTFVGVIRNALDYVKRLGLERPQVGMLALVEQVNPKIPETVMADKVAKRLQNECLIEGPIALDVAISADAARHKKIPSRIAGHVDILVMPNTTAANHLVKGLAGLGHCQVGGVIVGAQVPIILLSRSDDAETKLRSIALGLVAE